MKKKSDLSAHPDYAQFQKTILEQGGLLYRDMPWRDDTRPYYVLVSELMLQQTQVDHVIPKFETFITRFPDEEALAEAPLSDVLRLWSGLGYNRRAKFLHEAAKYVVLAGEFPTSFYSLLELPGVGKGTAGAIVTYAYNQYHPFIETNVRTVYFHHFFPYGQNVSDGEIMPLLEATVDRSSPREFYWALMDYGAWLKRSGVRYNSISKHYKKQTPLKGSVREIRGMILRALIDGPLEEAILRQKVRADDRFTTALEGVVTDGLVARDKSWFHLTK